MPGDYYQLYTTVAYTDDQIDAFRAHWDTLMGGMREEQARYAARGLPTAEGGEAAVGDKKERTTASEDRVREILDWTPEEQALAYTFLQDHAKLTRDRADYILRKAGWR